MNQNMKCEFFARLVRQGFLLAGLLALLLVGATVSRAQSGAPSAPTTAAKAANAPEIAPALPTAKSSAGVNERAAMSASPLSSPVETTSAKGQHEGITVHGHWVMEVKNPDGTRVSRQEFENALVQPGGAQDLTFLLLGGATMGGYRVILSGSSSSLFTGPCALLDGISTSCNLVGSLISPTPISFSDQNSTCGSLNLITTAGPCFPLSIAPVSTVANGFTGFVLSGTVTPVSTTVSITDVYSTPLFCSTFNTTSLQLGAIAPNTCAQSVTSAWSSLTHATLPSPVQITAVGQSISVTATISFQ